MNREPYYAEHSSGTCYEEHCEFRRHVDDGSCALGSLFVTPAAAIQVIKWLNDAYQRGLDYKEVDDGH